MSAYAVTTQCRLAAPNPGSFWIDGSATFTMEMFRTTGKVALRVPPTGTPGAGWPAGRVARSVTISDLRHSELPEIMEVQQSQIHVIESGEPLTASGPPSTIRAVTS